MSPLVDNERQRILIADDDEITCELLAAAIEGWGYDVITASNGAEAWELLTHNNVRLVICDWEMPVMNGLELCRRIREANLPYYVFIILVTGHGANEDIIHGLSAGADGFVVKPVNPTELRVKLRDGERVLTSKTIIS